MLKSRSFSLFMALVVALTGGCSRKSQNASSGGNPTGKLGEVNPVPEPQNIVVSIPAGTELRVAIYDTVQTNKNHVGDRIKGSLALEVAVDGKMVLPEGSDVYLSITKLVKGGHLKTPPELALSLEKIVASDGNSYPVSASRFYSKGRSHTKREVGMIGGGAVAGGIIGGLIGKGKGAAIGAGAGAAAGTGAAAATGRQNLLLLPGQHLNFTLQQPLTISMAQK